MGPFGLGASGDETPEEPPAEAAPVAKVDEKGGLAGIWESYNNALESKPILVKGLTSFTGFALGDILAQCFIEKDSEFDVQRLLRLASFGLLIHGPTSHYFYGALDNVIKGTSALAVASKVGIDQVLWNPIFGCAFFSYIGMLEGAGIEGCKLKIKNDLMTAVTGSWKVWPIAHAINFRFIPTSQRLLYINSIQIFYNVFLSIVANKT